MFNSANKAKHTCEKYIKASFLACELKFHWVGFSHPFCTSLSQNIFMIFMVSPTSGTHTLNTR